MNRTQILQKLKANRKNPDIYSELSNNELADLVVVVLSSVDTIEKAIKEGRLDGYTPKADKDYVSKETALKYLSEAVKQAVVSFDSTMAVKSTELDKRVAEAIERIRDGKDGVVSDEEILRAAHIAHELIELPDFDSLVEERITANPDTVRNALENYADETDKLKMEAVGGLVSTIKELREEIRLKQAGQGGGVSRNTVLELIAQNGGGGGTWGSITGTLSDQTDLQAELDAKEDTLVGATITGKATATAVGTDYVLISDTNDSGNLKKALISDFASAGGDMAAATYDPQAIGSDAFDVDNHTDGTTNKVYTATEQTKLAGIETGADVTDATNVAAAGALMDSEVTNLAQVKAFDSSDYATAAQGALADTAEQAANKDAVGGYAGLDGSGKINPSQLPALAISETFVVATEVAQLALTVQEGDIAVRTDENKSYISLNDTNATMADWQELLTPTNSVASVFGRSGTVTAQSGDYTTAQVIESTDKRYMTDAQETNLDNQSGTNTGDEPDASDTVKGIVELATPAECTTGTDTTRAVTPEGLKTVADTKANTASPTFTGTTATDLLTYDAARGKVTAGGNLGATETVNFNDETNYTGNLDSNITFTFANATSGDDMTLYLTYSGAQRTITWPTITWLDNATGAAPAAPAASGNVLVVSVRYVGTVFYASATGNYAVYA